jgi:hypothetical protein
MAQVYIYYYMCIITMQFFGSDWLLTRRSEYNEPLGSHCFRRMSHYSCVICIRSSDIYFIFRAVCWCFSWPGWPTRHKTFDGMRNSTLQCNVSKVTAHSFRTPSIQGRGVIGRTDEPTSGAIFSPRVWGLFFSSLHFHGRPEKGGSSAVATSRQGNHLH